MSSLFDHLVKTARYKLLPAQFNLVPQESSGSRSQFIVETDEMQCVPQGVSWC